MKPDLTYDRMRMQKALRYLETAIGYQEAILKYKDKKISRVKSVLFYLRSAKTFMLTPEKKIVKSRKKNKVKWIPEIQEYNIPFNEREYNREGDVKL